MMFIKFQKKTKHGLRGWPDRKDSSLNYEDYLKSNWAVNLVLKTTEKMFFKKYNTVDNPNFCLFILNKNLNKNLNIIPYLF